MQHLLLSLLFLLCLSSRASATLYCSARMFWCSSPYQHAFFLAPGSLYHPAYPARWTRNQNLWKLIGSTREVFYCASVAGKQPEVHYAGTYVCRHVGTLTNSELRFLSKTVRQVPLQFMFHNLMLTLSQSSAENFGENPW